MPATSLSRAEPGTEPPAAANDASAHGGGTPVGQEGVPADNPVRRTVERFGELLEGMEEVRETLRAHGVPLRVSRMLAEFALQKQPDKLAEAIDGALAQAARAHGEGTLDRGTLERWIADIVRLEEDMNHERDVARERGLDPRALAVLTQLIQQNPGDGGERTVNVILAYARACGISLDGVPETTAELVHRPHSVLPQVEREVGKEGGAARLALVRDALLGLAIGTLLILLLS